MTDRALSQRSPAVARAWPAARNLSRLCLPALLCAVLLWPAQRVIAQQFSQNGPKLTASDAVGSAEQGFSVALSGDGHTAIVGAPFDNGGAGAAWVFTRSGARQGWRCCRRRTARRRRYNSSTGQALIWLLNGATVIGAGSPGSAASPWTVAGTGDFNGDGMSDILWYNTTSGQSLIWFLNGTSVVGGGSPGSAASPWTIAETGDFNGDFASDILWYNTTSGQVVLWLLNGSSLIGAGSPGAATSPWQLQGMNAD